MNTSMLAAVGGALVVGLVNLSLAADHEIFVDKGETKTLSATTDEDVVALLDGNKDATLLKTGEGRLIIEVDLKTPGYKGEIRVHEGYLRLRNDGACGTTDGGVVVDDGATLEGDSSYKSGGLQFTDEPLTFSGFGVNGEGAVKMIEGSTWNFFYRGTKTMMGDSLWNGQGRLDVRFGNFDMGGHTFYASNSVNFVSANVVNPGRIVVVSGSPSVEASLKLNGSFENEFVFAGGKGFSFANVPPDADLGWSLIISNDVSVSVRVDAKSSRTNLASAVTYNIWKGPVWLAKGATLSVIRSGWADWREYTDEDDPIHHLLNLNGKISGEGALRTSNSGNQYGYLRVMYPNNDFTGGVTVDNGTILEAVGVASLGSGPLNVGPSGRLIFLNGSQWDTNTLTTAELGRILRLNSQLCVGKSYSHKPSNVLFPTLGDGTYQEPLQGDMGIYHNENNTLTLSGTITGFPAVKNTAGTLVLAGSGENRIGDLWILDGTVKIAANTAFAMSDEDGTGTDYKWIAAGAYPRLPRLVVGENAVLASRSANPTSPGLPLHALGGGVPKYEDNANFARGILEILAGAIVTNQLSVGGSRYAGTDCRTNNMGSVYLRGGTLVQHSANSNTGCYIGYNADGYFEIDDGVLDASKGSEWLHVGYRKGGKTPGHGVLHMKGGLIEHHSVNFAVNSGGAYGHLRVSGGLVTNDTFLVGSSLWSESEGGEGVVTLEGASKMFVRDGLQLGCISNSVSVLNLNGGELVTPTLTAITNRSISSGGRSYPVDYVNAGTAKYVNFNGGTLRMNGSHVYDWLSPHMTRYTVWSGGFSVYADASQNRRLGSPVLAPTGKGVRSVPFACDEPWRYIGAPYVRIVDPTGAGYGATACADFDSKNGVITGVTVTSPGCDYGEGTYAEISFGGWTNVLHVAVDLEDNANVGGFVKKGSGALGIEAVFEGGGTVRVDGGTLVLYGSGLLPNVSGFAVSEGAVFRKDAETGTLSGTLSGTGEFVGDYTLSGRLTVDAADLIAGRSLTVTGALTIAPGTVLEVLNAELLTEDMRSHPIITATGGITGELAVDASKFGPDWRISKSGGTLKFGHAHGTMLIVR